VIKTPLTRWFDLSTPIIGAPMAGVSGGEMARAVSQAGGLGMIGISGAHSADFLTEQCAIPATDQMPFGVGLMIWVLESRPDLLEATVAAEPSLVSVSFGDPAPYVGPLHDAGIAVCAQVNTTADVHRALDAGVDIVVAQGTEAGGHTGDVSTMVLIPEVMDAVGESTIVLAAGGIGRGRQMAAGLALGADGVWTGSIWLTVSEADTPQAARGKLLAASSRDTVRSRSWTGKPARLLKTAWTDAWEGERSPGTLPMPMQFMLISDALRRIGRSGDGELTTFPVGQIVGSMNQVKPAAQVVYDLIEEYVEAVERLNAITEG
jgi:NAD(P)H-dependent flavin oxidoreductase YrpB (nitropropane dioxygenase family)